MTGPVQGSVCTSLFYWRGVGCGLTIRYSPGSFVEMPAATPGVLSRCSHFHRFTACDT